MFVMLTGSSGVGKNTIIKELTNQNENIVLMPTFTTRDKRVGEIEGLPYFYISKEEFQNKIRNNEFIEYEHIHNNFYGSTFKVFDEYNKNNKILIKDIGVEGAQNICVKLSDRTKILKIFLTTKHKSDLKKRLKGRDEKQIKLRLKRYKYEQKQRNKFDFIIYNQSLEKTLNILNIILSQENFSYIPCKNKKKIRPYWVKYYTNKLLCGKILKPIKIAIKDEKLYIVSGLEKFIASVLSTKNVAKVIVDKKIKHSVNDENWIQEILSQFN